MFPSLYITAKDNFNNTLNKIYLDLDRWPSLPNSIQARISTIKMNVFLILVDNFVSSMLQFPPPMEYWDKLQAAISHSQIKLSTRKGVLLGCPYLTSNCIIRLLLYDLF